MKKVFHILFRLIFGLTLICLGVKTLTETSNLSNYVTQTIDQIHHKLFKKYFNISPLKQHATDIVLAEAFLFFASGLLTIFGFKFAKVLAFLAIVIELTMVHNVYFYREPIHLVLVSGFIAVFGGVLNI